MATTYYKVVENNVGETIAHVEPTLGATVIVPEKEPSKVRADKFLTVYIENNKPMAWGPVDKRTVYNVGKVTEADTLDKDKSVVSGPGLHAFKERGDAKKWMEQAEI